MTDHIDDPAEPDEDESCGDNHSWEYLYSVYECSCCGQVSEDD